MDGESVASRDALLLRRALSSARYAREPGMTFRRRNATPNPLRSGSSNRHARHLRTTRCRWPANPIVHLTPVEHNALHQPAEVRTKHVFEMADPPAREPAAAFDRHHIEPRGPLPQPMAAQVRGCGSRHRVLLVPVDRCHGSSEHLSRSRLDLDEHDLTSPIEHQIELAGRPPPVSVSQAVAFETQQHQGNELATTTGPPPAIPKPHLSAASCDEGPPTRGTARRHSDHLLNQRLRSSSNGRSALPRRP